MIPSSPETLFPSGIPARALSFSLLLLFLLSTAVETRAQGISYSPLSEEIFRDGLSHYQNLDYGKAAEVFSEIDDVPEAQLLRGNSLYALGRYQEAAEVLSRLIEAELVDISQEARFTLGLTELSRRNYEAGLLHLNELDAGTVFSPELGKQAEEQVLAYARFFSFAQRAALLETEAVQAASSLHFTLLREGLRRHGADEVRQLYTKAQRAGVSGDRLNELQDILQRRQEEAEEKEEDNISDESGKPEDIEDAIPELPVPPGFTYHIGVVLPQQDREERGYEVSRALYLGMLMAVQEYNQRQNERGIQLHLINFNPVAEAAADTTLPADSLRIENGESAEADSLQEPEAPVIRYTRRLLESQPLDLLFGPLFTSEAAELAGLAKEQQIPLIAPLANSQDLTEDNAWVFHANPTFAVRGARMAEIVTQYMGQRRISVLVEQGSLGEADALSFRKRAIELGAEIPYFFNENLQARQFDVRPFTRFFTSDVSLLNIRDEEEERAFKENLKPVDALYVPLTGQPAPTLFNLLMTQLQALRSNIQVIGSQELGSTGISEGAARRFELVYPETFYRDEDSKEAFESFEESYEEQYARSATEFSYIGYNLAQFMQQALRRAGNPDYTSHALRLLPAMEGLGQKINFDGGQINTALIPMRYGEDGYRPMFIPEQPIFDLVQERADELKRELEAAEDQE